MASPRVSITYLGDASQYFATSKRVQNDLQQTGLVAQKSVSGVQKSFGQSAQGISQSWSLIGQTFSSVNAPLGQFAFILPQIAESFKKVGAEASAASKKMDFQRAGGTLLGVGAGLTALGALFETFASKEETAFADFKTAIENTGASVSDYEQQLSDATAKMVTFGHGQSDVTEALSKLVVATQDPKKAFQDLSIAADYAARKHTSLSDAAGQLARVYAGGAGVGRVLRAFGIDVKSLTDTQKNLTEAHKAVAKATDAESAAKQRLADFYTRVHARGRVTRIDLLEEKKLQGDVRTAAQNHALALQGLSRAQKDVHDKGSIAEQALGAFEKRAGGAASAQAHTFTGHLKHIVAEAENIAAAFGKRVGPALVVLGPVLAVAGGLMQLPAARQGAAAVSGAALAAEQAAVAGSPGLEAGSLAADIAALQAEAIAATEASGATTGLVGAMSALAAPLAAIGALAFVGVRAWASVRADQQKLKDQLVGQVIPAFISGNLTLKVFNNLIAANARITHISGAEVFALTKAQFAAAEQSDITGKHYVALGQTFFRAFTIGLQSTHDFAAQLVAAKLKSQELTAVLNAIPPQIRSQVIIDITTINEKSRQRYMNVNGKPVPVPKGFIGPFVPFIGPVNTPPDAAQIHANVIARQQAAELAKATAGLDTSHLGGVTPSGGGTKHKGLTAAQKAVKSALDALAKTLRDLILPTGDFKAQLSKMRAETVALTAKAIEAQKQGLLSPKVVQQLQAFNRESGALLAKLQQLQDAQAKFNTSIANGFNKLLDLSASFTSSITGPALETNIAVQLQQAKQLSGFLSQAAKAGVSQGILTQAAEAGPDAIPFLRALVGLPKDQIKALNAEQNQIQALRNKTIASLDKQYFGPAFAALAKQILKLVGTFDAFINHLRATLHHAFPKLKFHTGGYVPGYPGTEVPIMALAGEKILTAQQQTGSIYNVNVTINAAPGMSEKTLSREAAREIAKQLHRFNQHVA